MIRRAKFVVVGRIDRTRPERGTVTITRAVNGVLSVRRYRSTRSFDLPLDVVARMVVERVIRGEVAAQRKARAAKRAENRKLRSLERSIRITAARRKGVGHAASAR